MNILVWKFPQTINNYWKTIVIDPGYFVIPNSYFPTLAQIGSDWLSLQSVETSERVLTDISLA